MGINKNDCLDCNNCIKNIYNNKWICEKGNKINTDKNGIVQALEDECNDFEYEE